MFLVRPGQSSQPVLLTDLLREQHEEAAKRLQRDQAIRQRAGAPLTDDGSPVPVLGEYVPPEHIEGIRVSYRVVSEVDRQALFAKVRAASGDGEAMGMAFVEVLRRCLHSLEGEGETYLHGVYDDDFFALLADNQLLVPLVDAALHFLSLPPKKALRCGQPAATSAHMTVVAAENHSAENAAVTAVVE